MADSKTLEYRENHPHCTFCEHSYISFFQTRCDLKTGVCKISATTCPNYKPVLEPIENRSLN